jgi:hypothetical protein
MDFDMPDLTEWNWIKCGMKPPADLCSLLLPASREMFWGDTHETATVCPCTINLSRMDSVVMEFTLNEEAIACCEWTISVTAISTNFNQVGDGMAKVVFVN